MWGGGMPDDITVVALRVINKADSTSAVSLFFPSFFSPSFLFFLSCAPASPILHYDLLDHLTGVTSEGGGGWTPSCGALMVQVPFYGTLGFPYC